MKKAISLLLALVLCLSLCACGTAKLTTAEVEQALADCDGKLDMQASGDNVTGFTYTVEGVNADELTDRNYSRNAINTVLGGDTSKITIGQLKVAKAVSPIMSIITLLDSGKEGDFNTEAFTESLLDIMCDGKVAQYNGWEVSAQIDQTSDSIIISVVSK